MHQDATWYGGRRQPRRLCVRRGPSPPLPQRGKAPQFSTDVYCGQMDAWIKMPLGTEVGLGLRDIVSDGDTAPPPLKRHSPPQFSANVHCGQTAGWIMMPLGTEVDLGPGNIILLDGVPALRDRGTAAPPLFGSCVLWPRLAISATGELLS